MSNDPNEKSDESAKPENEESYFSVDEFFISRTDKRGVICSGNDVFVRVSQYEKEELINFPHNKIRHPDMPKSVFKIFWQLLHANRVAVAFVKNRSRSGAYYWVIATVFPIIDGYFSIRFKPQSDLWKKAMELYQETLKVEKNEGMDGGQKFVETTLQSLGFETYEDFMVAALNAEFACRDARFESKVGKDSTSEKGDTALEKLFREVIGILALANSRIKLTSQAMQKLPDCKQLFKESGTSVAEICDNLRSLAVNMSLSSQKLGKSGSALSVVANSFQKTTSQILTTYQKYEELSEKFRRSLRESTIGMLSVRVLVEMLNFDFKSAVKKLGTQTLQRFQRSFRSCAKFLLRLNPFTQIVWSPSMYLAEI